MQPARGAGRRRDQYHWNQRAKLSRISSRGKNACKMVLWFGGRESIFLFSHTNEFCGKSKVAHEPGLACAPLKVRRRVYERGAKRRLETAA